MDFETLKDLYSKPLPFSNWQGDLLHHKEIKENLLKLEAKCLVCCTRDVSEEIIEHLTFLGNRNSRTVFWGMELLKQLKNPNQKKRFSDAKKTVWIIFRWFSEEDSFTWE